MCHKPLVFNGLWPHLSDFNKQHPESEVRLKGVDQDEGLLNKEIDIAIYWGKGGIGKIYKSIGLG